MDSNSHEICGPLSEVDRPAPLFAISFIYDEWAIAIWFLEEK